MPVAPDQSNATGALPPVVDAVHVTTLPETLDPHETVSGVAACAAKTETAAMAIVAPARSTSFTLFMIIIYLTYDFFHSEIFTTFPANVCITEAMLKMLSYQLNVAKDASVGIGKKKRRRWLAYALVEPWGRA